MIETSSLKLLPCEVAHLEAILTDQGQLARMLGVTVFDDWFVFPGIAGIEAIRYNCDYLKAHPEAQGWWAYLFLHLSDRALVGMGGFKGVADAEGMVEIGYAIIPAYEGRGLATEAAQGMIDYAFSHPHIKMVDAHTLAEPNASTRVLKKVGMKFVGAVNDPDEGTVWHWRLLRGDYRGA